MSVSSSLNGQTDQIVFVSDGSDQHWSPETNTQNTQSTQQWPGFNYNANTLNTPGPVYNTQTATTTQNPNYFVQNNNPQSYIDLTYQRRDCLIGNGYCAPNGNGITATSIGYNNTPQRIYSNNNYPQPKRANWNQKTNGVKKAKRVRTAFTTPQMMELELEYARTRYLDRNRRIELSETLNLSEKTIKVWFQNRRMKDKKDRAEGLEDSEATSTTESSPEMNVPYMPPCNYHTVQNGLYVQRNNLYMGPHSAPMPVLDASALPVPVHNTVANSYPNYFVSNVNVPEAPNQMSSGPSQFLNDLRQEDDTVTSELLKEPKEITDITPVLCKGLDSVEGMKSVFFQHQKDDEAKFVLDDQKMEPIAIDSESCKEESSPQSNAESDIQKANINEDNWELSWVQIMDLEEV
ncbi:unnamed protein product [Leptosia nina]|uniref:Homeobox domain-containing protein n=1 Tax=Leptosia nina TaxID=320188 RepID=A0AAV1J3A9_9NEOP